MAAPQLSHVVLPAMPPVYAQDAGEVAAQLSVDPALGLSTATASQRLAEYGPNALPEEAPRPSVLAGAWCQPETNELPHLSARTIGHRIHILDRSYRQLLPVHRRHAAHRASP